MKVSRAGICHSPSFVTFYLFCLSLSLSLSLIFGCTGSRWQPAGSLVLAPRI